MMKQVGKRKASCIRNPALERTYHLMMLPGVVILFLFSYVPMYGIIMAFQKYIPSLGILGSKWVGMQNYNYIFKLPTIGTLFTNTLVLACANLVLDIVVPIFFAILINEVRHSSYKRLVQTIVYLPHFLSWVVLGTVFKQIFANNGVVNNFLAFLGLERIPIMSSNTWFRPMLIITNSWQNFGWGTIIYLAAAVGIDPCLYESAKMDGASRIKCILHITLPGMASVIAVKAILSLGNVLHANFDQVFNLYNVLVYDTADIIDTYVYRMGLVQSQFSVATAVGLLKSVISCALIILSYILADKLADYRVF